MHVSTMKCVICDCMYISTIECIIYNEIGDAFSEIAIWVIATSGCNWGGLEIREWTGHVFEQISTTKE